MDWQEELTSMADEANNRVIPVSKWIRGGYFKAYIRVTQRYIPPGPERARTIDIASIEVDECERGKGHAKTVVSFVEELAKKHDRAVFVECVHNEIFAGFLERRGYSKVSIGPSYCKESNAI